MKSICIYSGSSANVNGAYLDAAAIIGRELASRGVQIVYGGGSTGLMGAVANSALKRGGEVIGVSPHIFKGPSLIEDRLTRLEFVDTMHERKARMAELSDGFIALPGGYGTLEEVFEAITWAQIGIHAKPVGLLNTAGYFDRLLAFIENMSDEGFIHSSEKINFFCTNEPVEMVNLILKSGK